MSQRNKKKQIFSPTHHFFDGVNTEQLGKSKQNDTLCPNTRDQVGVGRGSEVASHFIIFLVPISVRRLGVKRKISLLCFI